MKKILFPILVLVIILGMSDCSDKKTDDYDPMFPDGKPEYLTVTYHKDEGTTGEPPVDPNHYKPPIYNYAKFDYDFIDEATILDKGTLEKEGAAFLYWKMRTDEYTDEKPRWYSYYFYPVTNNNPMIHTNFKMHNNVHFDPEWLIIKER